MIDKQNRQITLP